MNDFLDKWKNDPRYKTKMKLLLYTLFVVLVAIYAISVNDKTNSNLKNELDTSTKDELENTNETKKDIFPIPTNYNYIINLNINDKLSKYTGTKDFDKTTIIKEKDNLITNYIYQNNQYYIEKSETYILTTENDVYDIINYNYINLENINMYLSKSTKENDEYKVYLKDIILENDSIDYFTIIINSNQINIDYTNLMKQFDNSINKYIVNIEIEEIEE